MLKNKSTYEIIAPETIGVFRDEDDCGVVMGKHSGRHALKSKLGQMGVTLADDQLNAFFDRFKLVAETKTGGVSDVELMALLRDEMEVEEGKEFYTLVDVQVVCGTMGLPTATAKIIDQRLSLRREAGSTPLTDHAGPAEANAAPMVTIRVELKIVPHGQDTSNRTDGSICARTTARIMATMVPKTAPVRPMRIPPQRNRKKMSKRVAPERTSAK